MRKLLLAAPLLLLVTDARGDTKVDCKHAQTQMDMDFCAGQDFTAADAKLNALYKQMMSKYDSGNQAMLRTAQRNWVAFRDAECAYETNLSVGGTIHPMMVTLCKTTKTNDRIKELNAQVHCGEGDLSCNVP